MSFSSAIVSFTNSCCNFNLDFLCLVSVACVAGFGAGSVATFGVGFAAASAAFSGFGSRVGILSKLFMGNNLLLNNNHKLF